MILSTRPLKFECAYCQITYFHPHHSYKHDIRCPRCHCSAVLLGFAEKIDFIQHPIFFMSLILKQQNRRMKTFENVS